MEAGNGFLDGDGQVCSWTVCRKKLWTGRFVVGFRRDESFEVEVLVLTMMVTTHTLHLQPKSDPPETKRSSWFSWGGSSKDDKEKDHSVGYCDATAYVYSAITETNVVVFGYVIVVQVRMAGEEGTHCSTSNPWVAPSVELARGQAVGSQNVQHQTPAPTSPL